MKKHSSAIGHIVLNSFPSLAIFSFLLIAALTAQNSYAEIKQANNGGEETKYSFSQALKNGEYFVHTRTFYFNRSFDAPDVDNSEAFTAGGIMKYESAGYHNFKFGLAPYGSFSLFGIVDRELGVDTGLLQSDGDDIAFLGEAYLDFDIGSNQFKLGWQQLSTPLMEQNDIRLLPTVYEAAVYRNTSLENTLFEVGYVSKYSGFTSSLSGFEEEADVWGEDGLGYIYITSNFSYTALRGEFIQTVEDSGTMNNYGYLDANVPVNIGDKTYIKGQFGISSYREGSSAKMYGVTAGSTLFEILDVVLLYNGITDNLFATVQAGPMYSDWQQGYGNYEPSQAWGGQLILRPFTSASLLLGYVDVSSEDGDEFNSDSYGETNIDVQYQITGDMKIRARYSVKDQEETSDLEDRNDFRVIFYFNF